jgi:hypothetical protein
MAYVIHYSKLKDRKEKCISQFEGQFKNLIFIDEDKMYLTFDKFEFTRRLRFGIKNFDLRYNVKNAFVSSQHLYCLNEILKSNEKYGIVFEDDVIINSNFHLLNSFISNLPEDFDIFCFGNGFDIHEKDENGVCINDGIYIRSNDNKQVIKCTDSYVISRKCCEIILDYVNNLTEKIDLPIDFLYEKITKEKNLKVYWCEPTLTNQGSQIGRYKSSLGNVENFVIV